MADTNCCTPPSLPLPKGELRANTLSDRPISYLYHSYYALTTSSKSHGFVPPSAPPSTNETPVYPTAIGAGGNRRAGCLQLTWTRLAIGAWLPSAFFWGGDSRSNFLFLAFHQLLDGLDLNTKCAVGLVGGYVTDLTVGSINFTQISNTR
ncbi:hypothetical protein CDAR_437811 [Caerostris darwini]|uniref:Uncharacterized protein n=1 Tax=Caerostris darwini TaxID=1538125 RepID=A0AAV4NU76_9ARAC|nr:hypothetical protein CDAR_437811 [Caerostris darwini]